jgi:hypothetical protein
MSYWEDSIREPLLGFGIKLTDEQLAEVCESIDVSHSNYSMFRGHDAIPNPLEGELKRTRQRSQQEIDAIEKRHDEKIRDLEYTIRRLRSRINELEDERRIQ